MPFCPQCRGEFQDWVKTCLDCGVPLVDKLPPPEPKKPNTKFSEEPIVPVVSYMYPTQAHLARAKLESLGIPAVVLDNYTNQDYWSGPGGRGIKVMVRECDLMQAAMALKDVSDSVPEEESIENEPEYFRCPNCNSTNVNLKCCDCGHEWREEEQNNPEESEA
jgi:hypothetical protein